MLKIGSLELKSRLILGTGKYPSPEIMVKCHEASGTDMVTVAVRRVDLNDKTKASFLNWIDRTKIKLLPNTAGCYSADDALRTAMLGRDALSPPPAKAAVTGDANALSRAVPELIVATKKLAADGLVLM